MSHNYELNAAPDETPELAVNVIGATDVFRFAFAMCHLQVEFMETGARILRDLRSHMGKKAFDGIDRQLAGGVAGKYADGAS